MKSMSSAISIQCDRRTDRQTNKHIPVAYRLTAFILYKASRAKCQALENLPKRSTKSRNREENVRYIYTVSQKKVPTFILSVTLSHLNRFSKFLQCRKAYEICYKTLTALPPQLRHVATLPWEIKISHFLQIFSRYGKCKQIAFLLLLTLLFIHKF